MKRSIANRLKAIAAQLPDRWEKEYEVIYLSGKDANLSFIGAKRPFKENALVEFQCPRFVQINHYVRLREGVKQKGPSFIGQYISRI